MRAVSGSTSNLEGKKAKPSIPAGLAVIGYTQADLRLHVEDDEIYPGMPYPLHNGKAVSRACTLVFSWA